MRCVYCLNIAAVVYGGKTLCEDHLQKYIGEIKESYEQD